MKTNLFKIAFGRTRYLAVLLLLMFVYANAWGDTWTWTSASTDGTQCEATTAMEKVTLNGKTWVVNRTAPCYYGWDGTNSVIQFGKNGGAETVVLSTTAIGGTITQVDVVCASYSAKHTCQIEVGGTVVKSATATASGAASAAAISTGTISKVGAIKITFTPGASARALYVKSITVKYTAGTTYNVDWVVGGTTAKSQTGVSVGAPPAVADNALGGSCTSVKFLGWSETNVGGTPTSAPADLFASDEVPALGKNVTYYAVFGDIGTNTSDTIRTQVLQYDTWTYNGGSNQSTYRLFGNGNYVESAAFDRSRLAKVMIYGGTYGGTSYNGISIKDNAATPNVWKTGTVSGTSATTAHSYVDGSALSGNGVIRVYSTSGNGTGSGVRMSKICIFTFRPTYSNCISVCCDKSVSLGKGASSNGTVTFSAAAVATCSETAADRQVTMTITPNAGYQLHGFTADGTISPTGTSPAIVTDNNSSAAQNITLTFAQNANGTYTATATFSEMTVTSWDWTLNSSAIPNPLELYVGQTAKLDVTYTPSGVLASHKTYTRTKDDTYINWSGALQSSYSTIEGRASTGESTTAVTFTHADGFSGSTKTVNVKVLPLPYVNFVDIVHNKTDFTGMTDGKVTATIVTNALVPSQPVPTRADVSAPVGGNSCETQHLHLIGWIYSEWSGVANYLNGTADAPNTSAITGATVGTSEGFPASTPCYIAVGSNINTSTWNGKTFYAVWAKEVMQ